VARALSHAASRGVTHRDVKPENIIINVSGQARVTDFGLAKSSADAQAMRVTQPGQTVGTPYYISPEQAAGEDDDVDVLSDLYALGATMFHMVTGHVPYDGETAAIILSKQIHDDVPWAKDACAEVPTDLCYVLRKCMAKDKGDRYASPEVLIQDLEKFLDGRCPRARSEAQDEEENASGVHPSRRVVILPEERPALLTDSAMALAAVRRRQNLMLLLATGILLLIVIVLLLSNL
jgi:serine/threonine protein kinase